MKRFNQQIKWVFGLFLVITSIEIINILTGRVLNQFGIIPRYIPGLTGIITSPFLHGSLYHYLSNIVPLCVFSLLMMQYGRRNYYLVSFLLMVITGLFVWLFARQSIHIGASGLIYGYFGFLILAGWRSKNIKLLLISVIVAFFYGGMIFGVLPSRPFISWESHLFGFLTGLLIARLMKIRVVH